MLTESEIECCKREAKQYIEFMETAGDNAGWTRGLLWYISKLEKRNNDYKKGIYRLKKQVKKTENSNNKEIAEIVMKRIGKNNEGGGRDAQEKN